MKMIVLKKKCKKVVLVIKTPGKLEGKGDFSFYSKKTSEN